MEKNLFGQPVKNDRVTYENIRKIAICWGDGCTTGSLLFSFRKSFQKTNSFKNFQTIKTFGRDI